MKTRNTNGKRKAENGKRKTESAVFTFPLSLFTLTLFSVLCTLYSCDSESIEPSPSVAPTRTVTVQLNAESKPGFGESTDNREQSTAGDGGANLCTLYSELCTLNPELCTLSTRSAGGTWVEGDEVIAQVMLTTDNGLLHSYVTLRRTAEGSWQVVKDKSYTLMFDIVVYYDYLLLAEDTYADLNTLTVKVPEGETATDVSVGLHYVPEMEVAITRNENTGAITRAEIITRADALTTRPEEWICLSTDTNGWYTDQARIRIHTGKAGDVVKYEDYTATTNSDGDAYFYLTEIGSNITITRNDVTVTLVPSGTTITAGQAYWHDASWSAADGLVVVKSSDIGANYTIPTGTETLYVTGTTLATNPNANPASGEPGSYIGAALAANPSVKNLILSEVTEIPQHAFFFSCTDLESVFAPKATTIGQLAFYDCEALTTVTFGSVIESMGSDVFLNVSTENCTLTLNPGQKQMVFDNADYVYKPGTEAVTAGTNQDWAGYTWGEIIIK